MTISVLLGESSLESPIAFNNNTTLHKRAIAIRASPLVHNILHYHPKHVSFRYNHCNRSISSTAFSRSEGGEVCREGAKEKRKTQTILPFRIHRRHPSTSSLHTHTHQAKDHPLFPFATGYQAANGHPRRPSQIINSNTQLSFVPSHCLRHHRPGPACSHPLAIVGRREDR